MLSSALRSYQIINPLWTPPSGVIKLLRKIKKERAYAFLLYPLNIKQTPSYENVDYSSIRLGNTTCE